MLWLDLVLFIASLFFFASTGAGSDRAAAAAPFICTYDLLDRSLALYFYCCFILFFCYYSAFSPLPHTNWVLPYCCSVSTAFVMAWLVQRDLDPPACLFYLSCWFVLMYLHLYHDLLAGLMFS